MLRSLLSSHGRNIRVLFCQKKTFLTNTYSCTEEWNSRLSDPIFKKINLEDLYNSLDQNFANKGIISAIDVDIYANSIKDAAYLDELRDLIHKLRLSADTGNTLDSTHYATIRNYIDYGNIQDLVDILKDPLHYGIFLDDFTANILLDKLLNTGDYERAAVISAQIMLQEEFSNEIVCAFCQYACYKYISTYQPIQPVLESPEPNKKVEEIKIRIKFLRNPYFDDHFDINDTYQLSGKTLAWISEKEQDNLNRNLEILGWLVYKKYDKLLIKCQHTATSPDAKIYNEVLDLLKKEAGRENLEQETVNVLQECISTINSLSPITNASLEESIKLKIENAINKRQNKDIKEQKQLIKSWAEIREEKLIEQTKRLDRAKRVQLIQEKQKQLETEEQKLWFFDNEEKIDLEIENKEVQQGNVSEKKRTSQKSDEDYIPPEILPKRK